MMDRLYQIYKRAFIKLSSSSCLVWVPTPIYLKMYYYAVFRRPLDLTNPKTFNEKLQWLKIHDHNPKYTELVDKFDVKGIVSTIIGEDYIIPTIGVWESPEEIDYSKLPKRFVLKTTHDSGGIRIINKEQGFDPKELEEFFSKRLKRNLYCITREWPYKNVRPKIIAEPYLEDPITHELRDFKLFCFNGKVKCMKIDYDRFTYHRANYYDAELNRISLQEIKYPSDDTRSIDLPQNYDLMKKFAEKISEGIRFARIDFYEIGAKIYFGEVTFFPASGFGEFNSFEWDKRLGEWLNL